MTTRDINIGILSFRLSVRLPRSSRPIVSKRLIYHHITYHHTFFSILVFQLLPNIFAKFRRGHSLLGRALNEVGVVNFAIFDQYQAICGKRHNIGQ